MIYQGKILFTKRDETYVIKFLGDVRVTLGPDISNFISYFGTCRNYKSMVVDLTETTGIDSTSLGMLAKISIKIKESFGSIPTIVSTNEDVTRILLSMGFDEVFIIIREPYGGEALPEFVEFPRQYLSEDQLREQVIDAHRVLMSLNENNRFAFKNLVEALEQEQEEYFETNRRFA